MHTPAFIWTTQINPAHERRRTTAEINETFREFTGIPDDVDVSDVLLSLVHPDDAEAVGLQWERARVDKSDYDGFIRYKRHDGVFRWHFYRVKYVGNGTWKGVAIDMHEAYMMRTLGALSPASINNLDKMMKILIVLCAIAVAILLINGWGIFNAAR